MSDEERLIKELWIAVFAAEMSRSGVIEHAEWGADKAVEIYLEKDLKKMLDK